MNNNNSLDNILWNIDISYNKQTLYLIAFLNWHVLSEILNVFVILDSEITADSAVYLFTQNYTQTAIACRDNK